MRGLNERYTKYFNKTYQRMGHVFQGRYKATIVQKDSYLLELSRYIVPNPVRAGLTNNPEDYTWSSYSASIGPCVCPEWLVLAVSSYSVRFYGNVAQYGVIETSSSLKLTFDR